LRSKLLAGELKAYLLFPSGGPPWPVPAGIWSANAYEWAFHRDRLSVAQDDPNPYLDLRRWLIGYPIVIRDDLDAVVGGAAKTGQTERIQPHTERASIVVPAQVTPTPSVLGGKAPDEGVGASIPSPSRPVTQHETESLYRAWMEKHANEPYHPTLDADYRYMNDKAGLPRHRVAGLRKQLLPRERWRPRKRPPKGTGPTA